MRQRDWLIPPAVQGIFDDETRQDNIRQDKTRREDVEKVPSSFLAQLMLNPLEEPRLFVKKGGNFQRKIKYQARPKGEVGGCIFYLEICK